MVWTNLGAAYLGNPILAKDEDQQRAIAAFKQALKLNPTAPNVAYNLGLIHRDRQEKDEALYWFRQAVKTNPGQMTGELVNAFVADPYLVFTPWLLGGNALAKFYQANKILGKVPRIAKGAAYGTIATPEATAYSVMHQLGTKGEIDANRVAVDTAIGGVAGLGFGIAFGVALDSWFYMIGSPFKLINQGGGIELFFRNML